MSLDYTVVLYSKDLKCLHRHDLKLCKINIHRNILEQLINIKRPWVEFLVLNFYGSKQLFPGALFQNYLRC